MSDVRASRAVLGAGLLLSAAYFALPTGGLAQAAVALGLLTTGLGLLTVRLHREGLLRNHPWNFLSAGLAVYTVASIVWYVLPVGFDRPLPFPSPLDGAFFTSYALLTLFFVCLLRHREADAGDATRLTAASLLDASIFACAALAVLWPTLIAPQLTAVEVSMLAQAVAVTYPVAMAVLFGLAVRLLLSGWRATAAEMLLVAWIGGELAADVFYGYLGAAGDFFYGHPMTLGWLLSYTALAAAALHPGLAQVAEPREHARKGVGWRVWLLLAGVVVPLIVLLTVPDPLTAWVMRGVALLAMVLIVARLQLVSGDLAEQRRLARELTATTAELQHRSLHDPLTGLGNRRLLMERLSHALRRRPTGPDTVTALLLMDLDGFKIVNDTLGHQVGDTVLVEVGNRLSADLRPADTVARLGGDEFAVLLEDITATQATEVAQRIVEMVRAPIPLGGNDAPVRASMGVCLAGYGADPDECLKHADVAMYAAKAAGGDRSQLFESGLQEAFLVRHQLEMALRAATERGELRLHYQPITDLRTGTPTGLEALVRWAHPQRGLLYPKEFMTTAEECGAIVDIGRWVLQESCRQIARWAADGGLPPSFRLAVNVSGREVSAPGFVDTVTHATEQAGIPADLLALEIVESDLMAAVDTLCPTLGQLRALGVLIAMDDFGTGLSSLDQLHDLPVDVLKIAGAFIQRVDKGRDDFALATAVVRVARSLGKITVAEGVESAAQLAHVHALQLDHAQGHLFAAPLFPDEAIAHLRAAPAARRRRVG